MAEFPDIFACVSCEKALFVDEKDRASEKYECPFCHHEHTPEEALGEDKPETPETAENAPIEATASEEPLEPNPAAAEPSEAPDTELVETTNEGDVELFVEEPSEAEPKAEAESDLINEEPDPEGDEVEPFIDEPTNLSRRSRRSRKKIR